MFWIIVNQTDTVSDLFKDQKTGFFIEAGAYDGELFSNSLFYELKLGWKGLLVEPNPDPLAELVSQILDLRFIWINDVLSQWTSFYFKERRFTLKNVVLL